MKSRLVVAQFAFCLVLLSWYGMMAIHELGHVLGAATTGGTVKRVVLHPLAISRTDVEPNPHPGIVVWSGPVLGCLVPLVAFLVTPRRLSALRAVLGFFAGFCWIANGAYLGVGAWDEVGDCREMLQTGTPLWGMVLFGVIATSGGLILWHQLGSPRTLWSGSVTIPRHVCLGLALALLLFLITSSVWSG